MKKHLLSLLALSYSFISLTAQTTISRNVVASTGGSAQVGNTLIQFTIGEVAVLTQQSSSLLLSQGFQQPEFTISSLAVPAVENMRVFPNPATSRTKVDFDLFTDAKVVINLVNNSGQIVHSSSVTSKAGKIEYVIPLNGLAAGLYHVVLYVNYRTFSEKHDIQ
jgi:hypothetical protein